MCPDLYAERNMPARSCREHCISKPFALNRRPENVGIFLTVMTDLHARRTSFHTYWNCLAALYGVWLLGWGQWMTQVHCLTLLVNMKSRIPPAYFIFCYEKKFWYIITVSASDLNCMFSENPASQVEYWPLYLEPSGVAQSAKQAWHLIKCVRSSSPKPHFTTLTNTICSTRSCYFYK